MSQSDRSASDIVLCHPVRETLRRAALDPALLGSVTMGNVVQAGNRMNPAR